MNEPSPASAKKNAWFIVQGDSRQGPFTVLELKTFASKGKIVRSTKIWKEGLEKPASAGQLKGLFSKLQVAPAETSKAEPKLPAQAATEGPNPGVQLGRKELRAQIAKQKTEIAEIALSKNAPQSDFIRHKERFTALTKEIETLELALPSIEAAGKQLSDAGWQVSKADENVKAAEKKLLSNAEELGSLGFQQWDVLPATGKKYFKQRHELDSKINSLKQKLFESENLQADSLVEKTKAKGVQLKLHAQIKVEALKVKSSNRQAGLALLNSNKEDLVPSNAAGRLLTLISEQRSEIDSLKQKSLELATPLKAAIEVAEKAVGQPVSDFKEFSQRVKQHEQQLKEKQVELSAVRSDVAGLVVADPGLARDLELTNKVEQLSAANKRLSESPNAISTTTTEGLNRFKAFSRYQKVASLTGGLIALIFLAWCFLGGNQEGEPQVKDKAVAKTNSGDSSPQRSASKKNDVRNAKISDNRLSSATAKVVTPNERHEKEKDDATLRSKTRSTKSKPRSSRRTRKRDYYGESLRSHLKYGRFNRMVYSQLEFSVETEKLNRKIGQINELGRRGRLSEDKIIKTFKEALRAAAAQGLGKQFALNLTSDSVAYQIALEEKNAK